MESQQDPAESRPLPRLSTDSVRRGTRLSSGGGTGPLAGAHQAGGLAAGQTKPQRQTDLMAPANLGPPRLGHRGAEQTVCSAAQLPLQDAEGRGPAMLVRRLLPNSSCR